MVYALYIPVYSFDLMGESVTFSISNMSGLPNMYA